MDELNNLIDGESKLIYNNRKAVYILKQFNGKVKKKIYHKIATLTSIILKVVRILRIQCLRGFNAFIFEILDFIQDYIKFG